jgi:hypothetical protein
MRRRNGILIDRPYRDGPVYKCDLNIEVLGYFHRIPPGWVILSQLLSQVPDLTRMGLLSGLARESRRPCASSRSL